MNIKNGHSDELWELMESLCEQRLTSAQASRLEELVLSDPEARSLYLKYIDLHGALHWDTAIGAEGIAASAEMGPLAASLPLPLMEGLDSLGLPTRQSTDVVAFSATNESQRARRRSITAVAVAACVVVVSLTLSMFWGRQSSWHEINVVRPDGVRNPDVVGESHVDANSTRQEKLPVVIRQPNDPQPGMQPDLLKPSQRDSKPGAAVATNSQTKTGVPERNKPNGVPREVVAATAVEPGSLATLVSYVDQQIKLGWEANEIQPSPVADDAEWVRRVYLDVVGHIPPAVAVEQFLSDKSPDKRTRLVDQLTDGMGYVRNWTTVWTNLLIGRSDSRDVNRRALQKYLRNSFAKNRPWNEMVYDFVSAEGNYEDNGATNFLLAHLNNQAVPATAITARLFMGIQVQCTQCHPHPFNDRTQNQFWELNSFFQQTAKVRDRSIDPKSGAVIGERTVLTSLDVGGPTYFETRRGVMRAAFPRFEGVRVDADKETNRRAELARLMTSGDQPKIAQAMVNRMWAHFFGHAFTHSVDDMGPHNPPTHPQVLNRMADEFVKTGYDLKQLIRVICQTDAYQRTSRFNDSNGIDDPATGADPLFSRVYVKSMTAEQMYDSLIVATKADQAASVDWAKAEQKRQEWLQQFVIAFQTEENDEVTTFDGTIPQALMMMNSELVDTALRAERGTYLDQVVRERSSDTEKIKKLCLSALSRYPTSKEIAAVRKMLRDQVARRPRGSNSQLAVVTGLQDVFWAYLNSNEFILIH